MRVDAARSGAVSHERITKERRKAAGVRPLVMFSSYSSSGARIKRYDHVRARNLSNFLGKGLNAVVVCDAELETVCPAVTKERDSA